MGKRFDWRDLPFSQKTNILLGLFNTFLLIFNAITFVTVNQRSLDLQENVLSLQEDVLNLQRIMSNYTTFIIARADWAYLESSSYSHEDGILVQTVHFGYLGVELEIVTPHYGRVVIRIKDFNEGESNLINPERRGDTLVSFFDDEEYEDFVVQGLNYITVDLHLEAVMYPNYEKLRKENLTYVQFPLGFLVLEVELYDLQTNVTTLKEFKARIMAVLDLRHLTT